jgi:hypothetical protein
VTRDSYDPELKGQITYKDFIQRLMEKVWAVAAPFVCSTKSSGEQ